MITSKINLNSDFFSNKVFSKEKAKGNATIMEEESKEEESLTYNSIRKAYPTKIGLDHRVLMNAASA